MKKLLWSIAAGATVVLATGASAQTAIPKGANANTAPIVAILMKDAAGVGDKMVALANAIPESKYDWRPNGDTKVRSVREVMLHVASDNYLIPALGGAMAPAATGIDLKDYKSVERYEKRALAKDAVVKELEESFTHLANVMGKTTPADLTKDISMFGQKAQTQELWVMATTHLHEHLGQAIAYARTNAIVPPWSK